MPSRGVKGLAVWLLAPLAIAWLLCACSPRDKHKEAFMGQCAIAKPMEEACSCTYDRMTAEIPVAAIAASLESGKQDPKVAAAIQGAFITCTAKYR